MTGFPDAALGTLTAARLWVVGAPTSTARGDDAPRDQPYLTRALYTLHAVPSTRVPRMGAGESWRLYVNPDWLACATVPEAGRELVHILWHLLNDHASRARATGVTTASAARWHVYCDRCIADLTEPAKLRPDTMPRSPFPPGRTPSPEEQFTQTPPHRECDADLPLPDYCDANDCGSCVDGIPRTYEQDAGTDLPAVTRVEAELIRRETARGAAAAGTGNTALIRWAEGITAPVVPWPQVLSSAVRRAVATASGAGDYSYRRPSRRSASAPDVVLPSRYRPVPEVAVVVDTSASMNAAMLGRAVAELDAIMRSAGLGAHGLTAIAVDTAAYARRVRRATDIDLVGGGGTNMALGIAAAAVLQPRPELTVVLTDGYTPWPADPVPGMSVIAALIGDDRHFLPETPAWISRIEVIGDGSTW